METIIPSIYSHENNTSLKKIFTTKLLIGLLLVPIKSIKSIMPQVLFIYLSDLPTETLLPLSTFRRISNISVENNDCIVLM